MPRRIWKETGMSDHLLYELNPAESMVAPFNERQIVATLALTCEAGAENGWRLENEWDSTRLKWDHVTGVGPLGSLTLALGRLPARFDAWVFCLVLPAGVRVSFSEESPDGWQRLGECTRGVGARMEITHPRLANNPTGLRAEFAAEAELQGPGQVSLQWWGVADRDLLARLAGARPMFDPAWPGLIKPAAEWGEPAFARGLLFAAEDLPALRTKADHPVWRAHVSAMEERARNTLTNRPEEHIGDYLPWSDYRYLREREQGQEPWFSEPVLCALVGLLRRDESLIRHALRFLMSFVHTTHWCQSAESRTRGSTWDQRCFIEEMATTTCALVFDWLYFALTDRARDLVRVALWDKGVSIIQRDMVKWEYVHTMNQGPWFCRARILAGLVMEPAWPRVKPYVDQAYADLREGMDNYLLDDGGVDEGVGYFSVTLQGVLPGLMAYARGRDLPVAEVLPPKLARCGNFVAIMSAMAPGKVLLDGDNTNERFTGDLVALMASLYPRDIYAQLARATLLPRPGDSYYRQYMIDGPFAFIAGPTELPEPRSIVPEFGRLPQTGQLTSRREVAPGRTVRVHVSGCKARASHTHYDKGGFTVELDEAVVLIDRGQVRYDDSRSHGMKRSAWHNVLTPLSPAGEALDQNLATVAVIPEGEGDAQSLHARVDLAAVWRDAMSACVREFESDDPGCLTITDCGELRAPGDLAFHLQTRRPWTLDQAGKCAVLAIPGWRMEVAMPWADEIGQATEGIDLRLESVWHLQATTRARTVFELRTTLRFFPEV